MLSVQPNIAPGVISDVKLSLLISGEIIIGDDGPSHGNLIYHSTTKSDKCSECSSLAQELFTF